jgi:hypothetical protein
MRASDVARLSQPYDGDPNQPGPGPAAALGVDTPTWLQLETTILDDLRTEPPYGIAWWAPHPGTSRRILITDQLYACTHSTGANLIEAGLHWLEFLDFAERESDRLVYAVKIENGEFVVKAPRRQSPFEDVGLELVRLHVAGMVRALAGALDCMAGSIIGVAALPTRILRADLVLFAQCFGRLSRNPLAKGRPFRLHLAISSRR